ERFHSLRPRRNAAGAAEITDARGFESLLVRRGGHVSERGVAQLFQLVWHRNRDSLHRYIVTSGKSIHDSRFNESRCFFRFRLVLERALHLLDDRLERDFIGDREIGQDLAIKTDVRRFQSFGEPAVSETLGADRSIEPL